MLLRCFQNIGHNMYYKIIFSLYIAFSITYTFNIFPVFAQQQGVNWLEICKNPLVNAFITEPCENLTSPDGYTLTPLGERVLGCISGGTLAVLIAQPELLALRDAVGCGPNSGDSSLSDNTQSTHSGSSSIGSSIITSQSNPNEDSGSSSCATITQDCPNNISNSSPSSESNQSNNKTLVCTLTQFCSNPTELQSSISSTNNNISNILPGSNETTIISTNSSDLSVKNTSSQSHVGISDQF